MATRRLRCMRRGARSPRVRRCSPGGRRFARAGDLPLQGLGRWDGASWSRLGSRDYPWSKAYISDFAEFDCKLALGGYFSVLNGTTSLMLWNGRHWEPVGPGYGLDFLPEIRPIFIGFDFSVGFVVERHPAVTAFGEYQGDLIAAGEFEWAGQKRARNIARWDRRNWTPLGGGISGTVSAMTTFAGELVVGGSIDSAGAVPVKGVAAWNGTRWRALGDGLHPGGVLGFTEYGGKLIAVGSFHRASGRDAHGVAAWDGERWTPVGVGIFNGPSHVLAHDGMLIAAGDISWNGYQKVQSVVRWTGTRWKSLAGGSGPQDGVTSLLEYDGGFLAVLYTGELYFWNVVSWMVRGHIPFRPRAVIVHDSTLFAVGLHSVGNRYYTDVARLDGRVWRPLGSGVDYSPELLFSLGGSLYVGGSFTRAGPYSSVAIARWGGAVVAVDQPIEDPGAEMAALPLRTQLLVAGPSPEGTVRVEYALASDGLQVDLAIYDVRGRLVRMLERGTQEGGRYARTWDRRDERGIAVARGAYFVRLAAGRETLTRKLALWR